MNRTRPFFRNKFVAAENKVAPWFIYFLFLESGFGGALVDFPPVENVTVTLVVVEFGILMRFANVLS